MAIIVIHYQQDNNPKIIFSFKRFFKEMEYESYIKLRNFRHHTNKTVYFPDGGGVHNLPRHLLSRISMSGLFDP